MEGNPERYKQEIIDQERKANRHIIAGFRYFLIAAIIVWVLTVMDFFIIDKVTVSITLVILLPMLLLPLYIAARYDLSNPRLKYFFLVIVCVASNAIAAILTYHAVLIYILPLLFAIQCRQRRMLWITYAVNTGMMIASSLIGFYFGLCDLNILLQGNYPRSWYLENAVDGVVSLPLNGNIVFLVIAFEVFPRAVILLVFALMLQYTVVQSGEDAVRIAELTWRKETDVNTGVYNKNKYEEMADEYYLNIPRIAAVYWDLNNLKKTNDKFGHAMGDALIATLSKCLMDEGDERYRVYRLGGDEFLMLIDNPQLQETEGAIKGVQARLKKCYEEGGPNVSSAVGWSTGEGKRVREVVNKADANMYANKVAGKEGRGK